MTTQMSQNRTAANFKESIVEFYNSPAPMSDPKHFTPLLADMPAEVSEIVKVLQNCLLHIFWAERYGVHLTDQRKSEVSLRPVWRKLERMQQISPGPLTGLRSAELRLVGNCRDFTLMLTTMLRARGIPARSRCGFGTYFMPGHYEDHWVAEYWHTTEQRWVMVDAQLDALQQEVLHISFNPLDIPAGQFVVGGAAWLMARREQANPASFGIMELSGMDFIKGDLLRDLLALIKFEVLPWDFWGIVKKEYEQLTTAELALLDHAAEISVAGDTLAARTLIEQNPEFQAPGYWAD